MQGLTPKGLDGESEAESDSFADRAENYYQKRPQLLTLLKDLHSRYLSLADRYCTSLKHNHPQLIPTVHPDEIDDDPDPDHDLLSSVSSDDVESSLSFHNPPPPKPDCLIVAISEAEREGIDDIVAEFVWKTVENEVLLHELGIAGKQSSESIRKIELQKSLLEVLESERMVLLNENARLGFRATALSEESERLAAEVSFMRRKAGELARCVLKMRDDHRVCILSRRIEGLQGQIFALEKRNVECYQAMARREEERRVKEREAAAEVERLKAENRRLKEAADGRRRRGLAAAKAGKWWIERVRSAEGFLCGRHVGKTATC
ncbi:hypothetical protein QJS10_CPA01g00123 [Acorus calamus]|uniref:NAB domain-containing protein n=1 Tax=Acorus calamus TaxID=4465 RepID=A0AAV9FKJ5_ACOCL|nr:hypothetical protein QJS10_CPA01g00123 [Acorus calamus]